MQVKTKYPCPAWAGDVGNIAVWEEQIIVHLCGVWLESFGIAQNACPAEDRRFVFERKTSIEEVKTH